MVSGIMFPAQGLIPPTTRLPTLMIVRLSCPLKEGYFDLHSAEHIPRPVDVWGHSTNPLIEQLIPPTGEEQRVCPSPPTLRTDSFYEPRAQIMNSANPSELLTMYDISFEDVQRVTAAHVAGCQDHTYAPQARNNVFIPHAPANTGDAQVRPQDCGVDRRVHQGEGKGDRHGAQREPVPARGASPADDLEGCARVHRERHDGERGEASDDAR